MRIEDLRGMKRQAEMPLGTQMLTFKKVQYRTDEDGEIKGVFVHTEEFKSLYIPFFDNGENFQLDFLLDQLGCESYDPEEINQFTGTKIIVTRYQQNVYKNVSFNPNYAQTEDTILA